MIERGEFFELHLGDWRDPETGVEKHREFAAFGAVIEDPPYGERTHVGQKIVGNTRRWKKADGTINTRSPQCLAVTGDLGYNHLTPDDARLIAYVADRATNGWTCTMTSHDLVPVYETALRDKGRYVFAPLPIVVPGMSVRIAGDGPSNWTVYMVVSRRRSGKKCWGTKPGAYTGYSSDAHRGGPPPIQGSKPLSLMEAIVRDYTDPGDLVLDRFTGSGTTGVAAIRLGRRFVGWERKPEHFEIALARLRSAVPQRDMWEASPTGKQEPLL